MNPDPVPGTLLADPTDELRQGDICFDWPYPKWDLNNYMVASAITGNNAPTALMPLYDRAASLPIVICSHDCELEDPRQRLGIIVAPVFPWP